MAVGSGLAQEKGIYVHVYNRLVYLSLCGQTVVTCTCM